MVQAWRPLAILKVLSSSGEAPLGEKGPARWSQRLWSRLGLGAGAWIPAPVLFFLPEGPGRVGKERARCLGGRGRGLGLLVTASGQLRCVAVANKKMHFNPVSATVVQAV